jgi:hypothetical protein
MLRQLSSIEHEHKLHQLRRRRYQNTGIWVTKTDQFRRWDESNTSSCLWCYGIRCALTFSLLNKLTFCSWLWEDHFIVSAHVLLSAYGSLADRCHRTAVIDSLRNVSNTSTASTSRCHTVHFFCNYADPITLSAAEIFGSLAKQLLTALGQISEEIEKKISKAYGDGTLIPDGTTVWHILVDIINLFKRVYIVLDGVDECKGEDRLEVISAIQSLYRSAIATGIVKIFVASRADVDIERALQTSITLSVDSSSISSDIELVIRGKVEEKSLSGELFVRDRRLLDEIIGTLTEKADGMYETPFHPHR